MAILRYEYDIIGQQKVAASLASVERMFAQHANRLNRTMGATGGTNGRLASARTAGTAGSSAARTEALTVAKQQRETAQYWQRAQRDSSRFREAQERKAQAEQIRGIKRVEAEGASAGRRTARMQFQTQRMLADEHQRNIARAEQAGARTGRRVAQTQIQYDKESAEGRQRFLRNTVGGGASRVLGGIASVGKMGAAVAGIGGAALASTAVTQAIGLDESARRLAIQGRNEGEVGANPDDLRRAFVRTGIASGIAPEQVAAGASAYVQRTGDLDTAMANLDTFATTAQATGAGIEDVARAAADMSQKMDIKSVEDMQKALAVLTIQGKRGAFELKDMAQQFPEMASTAANAGVKGVKGVTELGAIAQVAMQATGSGAEASTSVQAMFRQLAAKSEDIQAGTAFADEKTGALHKVQVFEGGDAKKPMRNFLDVIGDMMQASGGNLVQLGETLDVRGIRAINPLLNAYRTANNAMGGGKSGDKAGRSAMQQVLAPFLGAPTNFNEIERDAADAMKSTGVQLEILSARFKDVLAGQLFPVLNRLIPVLGEFAPAAGHAAAELVTLASVLAENPFSGIAAILGVAITAEIAQAGIATLIEKALTTQIGMIGTGGLAIGAMVASVSLAKLYVESLEQKAKSNVEAAAQSGGDIRAKAASEYARTGFISEDTKAQLTELGTTEQATISKGKAALGEGKVSGFLRRGWNSLVGNEENLQQGATLQEVAGNADYNLGAQQTQALLDIANSDAAKQAAESAKIQQAATEAAAEAIKKAGEDFASSVGGAKPNRGNAPSPVKS